MLICPQCDGQGSEACPVCGGSGEWAVTRCPLLDIGQGVLRLIELAELYEKGLPPSAGGAMDQAAGFVAAARMVWAEEKFWKHKLGIMS